MAIFPVKSQDVVWMKVFKFKTLCLILIWHIFILLALLKCENNFSWEGMISRGNLKWGLRKQNGWKVIVVKNYVELIDLRLCSNPNHRNLVQKRLSLYQLLSPFLLAYLSSDALSLPLHQNYFLSKRGDIRPSYKTILNT